MPKVMDGIGRMEKIKIREIHVVVSSVMEIVLQLFESIVLICTDIIVMDISFRETLNSRVNSACLY